VLDCLKMLVLSLSLKPGPLAGLDEVQKGVAIFPRSQDRLKLCALLVRSPVLGNERAESGNPLLEERPPENVANSGTAGKVDEPVIQSAERKEHEDILVRGLV